MPQYRIYLRRACDIVAREDVTADDDVAAAWIGAQLCDACRDQCDEFEVWAGSRLIAGTAPSAVTPTAIRERRQASLILAEETLSRSRWQIAKSTRLLKRLNESADGNGRQLDRQNG